MFSILWYTTVTIFNIVQLIYLFDSINFLPISLDFRDRLTQIQWYSFLKPLLTFFLNLVSPWPSEYVLLYLLSYVATSVQWFASTLGTWLISFLSLLVSFWPSFHSSCPNSLDRLHEWNLHIADRPGWCWGRRSDTYHGISLMQHSQIYRALCRGASTFILYFSPCSRLWNKWWHM